MRTRLFAAAALTAIAVPATALATAQDTYKLSGKADVPMGAPNGSGTAEIDLKSNQVCWSFKTKGIDKPTAAHIHKGVAGKAGPVVVAFGATYKASGCVKAPKATIEAIEHNEKGYYVNIHTAKYPAGAVRAQLS